MNLEPSQWIRRLQACLQNLQQTNGNLDKVAILRQYTDLQPFFMFYMDGHAKTGVTVESLTKYQTTKFGKFPALHAACQKMHPMELLTGLTQRQWTGDEAKERVCALATSLSQQLSDPQVLDLIKAVAGKDLPTRLGPQLIASAFGNKVTSVAEPPAASDSKIKIQVALAEDMTKHIDKFQQSSRKGDTWFLSRKMDGVRCLLVHNPRRQHTVAYSRTGNPFLSLQPLVDLVKQHVRTPMVLDMEICVLSPDGQEDFIQAVKQIKKASQEMTRFCAIVLDTLDLEEFEQAQSCRVWSDRRDWGAEQLASLLTTAPDQVRLLHVQEYSPEAHQQWQDECQRNNWEGLMLRKDAPYRGRRTADLLKEKQFETAEFKITGIKTGLFPMIDPSTGLEKIETTVTAVSIVFQGQVVWVGSGFSVAQRKAMFQHPERYIGKEITVRYFETSKNQKGQVSLRFPTVVHVWSESGRDV